MKKECRLDPEIFMLEHKAVRLAAVAIFCPKNNVPTPLSKSGGGGGWAFSTPMLMMVFTPLASF